VETSEVLLKRLTETVAEFLRVCQDTAALEIYEGWTAQDVLGHITFWHESFARNVDDLVHERNPTPLKGRLRDLNQGGVDEMRQHPLEMVVARLEAAQGVIQNNILNPRLTLIPYTRGSRDYTPEEHLDIVCGHIQKHLREIEAAARKNKRR